MHSRENIQFQFLEKKFSSTIQSIYCVTRAWHKGDEEEEEEVVKEEEEEQPKEEEEVKEEEEKSQMNKLSKFTMITNLFDTPDGRMSHLSHWSFVRLFLFWYFDFGENRCILHAKLKAQHYKSFFRVIASVDDIFIRAAPNRQRQKNRAHRAQYFFSFEELN